MRRMSDHVVPTGREELQARIVRRAAGDETFRAWLLDNPRAALEDELGISLPQRLQVQVVQERPDSMCIVLPVDLSGMGHDAVWAMTGRQPR